MDSNGGEHMDPVQLRFILHLLHLLLRPQINPKLRPINARHRLRLQRHRCQRRRLIGPPLLLRHTQFLLLHLPRTLGGPRGGCDPVLPRLFSDVGLRRRIDPPASGAVDVPLHVSRSSFSDFLQHRQRCQWLRKLSELWWDHRWNHEGIVLTCVSCLSSIFTSIIGGARTKISLLLFFYYFFNRLFSFLLKIFYTQLKWRDQNMIS